jgi:NAD(P)-dependent dehydrogenase (short-subunit alcohol dehydrogenase family)
MQKREYQKWPVYGQPKTAIILISKALASKLGNMGTLSYSVDTGGESTPPFPVLEFSYVS